MEKQLSSVLWLQGDTGQERRCGLRQAEKRCLFSQPQGTAKPHKSATTPHTIRVLARMCDGLSPGWRRAGREAIEASGQTEGRAFSRLHKDALLQQRPWRDSRKI